MKPFGRGPIGGGERTVIVRKEDAVGIEDGSDVLGSDGLRFIGGLADSVRIAGSDGRRALIGSAGDGHRDVAADENGMPVLGASADGGTAGNRRTAEEGRSVAGTRADCAGIGGRGTLGGDVRGCDRA